MVVMAAEARARILAAVDESEVVGLLRRAIQVPSVTGDERAFAEFLADELRASGLDHVELFDFAPGRPNVWGVLRGSSNGAGAGRSLMVLGHLDTVHAAGWGASAFWSTPWSGNDAVRAGHELLTRLWRHHDEIWASRNHPLIGRPSLLVTEVSGGGQIAVPDQCVIKLIRKLVPGEVPEEARQDRRSTRCCVLV